MARRKHGSVPGIRRHKPSGQAVVTLSGQDFYCGAWGTKVALAEYDRLVAEWLARGRRATTADVDREGDLTLVELAARYKTFAKGYYRKNGKVTSEVDAFLSVAKVLTGMYGRESANDFGPLKLQAVQQAMIRLGWTRRNINKQQQRIVRMFGWAVSQELVKPDVAHALREVKGLHKGRTDAKESPPVLPVDLSVVNATLDHLPPIVADMVRLQRLTGCRPEEVCLVRPCDLDRSGSAWAYRPHSHKTSHHGRERVIFVGPKGQDVLLPYLLRDAESYCFDPAEGERKRRDVAHALRTTPPGHGNRPGTNRKRKPARQAGQRYTTNSYRRAIHRACELAFQMPDNLRKRPTGETAEQKNERLKLARQWRVKHTWHPNRLRHSAATEIRKRFGLEAAQVTLGHSAADVTQIYAERDLEKAAAVMAQIG
ncbi:MAG: site-specific integrase [Pirellulaceae bacterium]